MPADLPPEHRVRHVDAFDTVSDGELMHDSIRGSSMLGPRTASTYRWSQFFYAALQIEVSEQFVIEGQSAKNPLDEKSFRDALKDRMSKLTDGLLELIVERVKSYLPPEAAGASSGGEGGGEAASPLSRPGGEVTT